MTIEHLRVRLVPGDGVVARYEQTLVLAAPVSEAQESALDTILEWCEEGISGGDLIRRVAAIALTDDGPASLGLITAYADGVALLLRGDVVVSGDVDLDGADALTVVDRVLPRTPEALSMQVRGSGEPDRRSDLRGGMVRASGVALAVIGGEVTAPVVRPATGPVVPPETAPEPIAEPEPILEPDPVDEAEAFTTISLLEPEPEPELDPGPETALVESDPRTPTVRGVVCSRGHFTDPVATVCRTCGVELLPGTETMLAPRPALGRLVADDGLVVTLDDDLLLGRDPGEPDNARPVTIDDPQLSLSRVHARVMLDGWEVRVEDKGSSNGTFIAAPGGQWRRLEVGVPTTLEVGESVALGAYVVRYDS